MNSEKFTLTLRVKRSMLAVEHLAGGHVDAPPDHEEASRGSAGLRRGTESSDPGPRGPNND
jgi:hypothetical protein